jgi:hypothetical protein
MRLKRHFGIRLALVVLALAVSGLRTSALADDSLKIKLVVPTDRLPRNRREWNTHLRYQQSWQSFY